MTHYQALLDQAVSLVQAERGFVVLCESQTGAIQSFVAEHNFEPPPLTQDAKSLSNDDQSILKAIPRLVMQGQAFCGHNVDAIFALHEGYEGAMLRRPVRSVLSVPLPHASGLLWCDLRFRSEQTRIFDKADLQALIDLVAQYPIR